MQRPNWTKIHQTRKPVRCKKLSDHQQHAGVVHRIGLMAYASTVVQASKHMLLGQLFLPILSSELLLCVSPTQEVPWYLLIASL
jgi:hypothetical protein